MMKSLYTIILLLSTIGFAHAGDTAEAKLSPFYNRALVYVPVGSEITEIIPARDKSSWIDGFYIKFDFEGTCYLAFASQRSYSLTMIGCG